MKQNKFLNLISEEKYDPLAYYVDDWHKRLAFGGINMREPDTWQPVKYTLANQGRVYNLMNIKSYLFKNGIYVDKNAKEIYSARAPKTYSPKDFNSFLFYRAILTEVYIPYLKELLRRTRVKLADRYFKYSDKFKDNPQADHITFDLVYNEESAGEWNPNENKILINPLMFFESLRHIEEDLIHEFCHALVNITGADENGSDSLEWYEVAKNIIRYPDADKPKGPHGLYFKHLLDKTGGGYGYEQRVDRSGVER